MISANVIKAATAAFAQIDTSGEDAKIAEIEQQIADKQRAIDAANQRVGKLHDEIRNYSGPSGREIAEALMTSSTATTAALASPDLEALKTERANLQAGIGELNRNIVDLRADIQSVQDAASTRARVAAQPLIDEIVKVSRECAEDIVAMRAAMIAIARAVSRHGVNEERAMKTAFDGLVGQWGLLEHRKAYPVPSEIIDALRALNLKGPALRGGIVEEVGHG